MPEGLRYKHFSLTRLAGDASEREFYRLKARDGSVVVAMSGYAQNYKNLKLITEHFLKYGVPVPRIFGIHKDVILVEDLGDNLLADYASKRGEKSALPYYRRAISLIAKMRLGATKNLPKRYFAYKNRLDEEKFFEELLLTYKYYFCGLLNIKSQKARREAVFAAFREIARRAAAQPLVLCHRDYHARNILLKNRRLGVVDHQDARLGPYTYDLVSLLRDSYAVLSNSARENLKKYFLKKSKLRPRDGQFDEDFEWCALQRNLKAIGTFAYQKIERGTDRYLPYIPPTLRYVFQSLKRFSAKTDKSKESEAMRELRKTLTKSIKKIFSAG